MTKQDDLVAELKAKVKSGLKPSDLKKKTTPQADEQEKYLQRLENEHAQLSAEKEN
jgi:hypothetical protein